MKLRDQHPVFFLYILGVILSLVACAGSGANLPQRTTQQPTAILQTSTTTSPPAAGGIKGTVQEAQTGKAIATAYIVFQSEDGAVRLDTFSDANGDYQIELPKGRYRVTAIQEGYLNSNSVSLIETSGVDYTTNPITLTPKGEPTVTAAPTISATCAGIEYNGFCWYFGDANLSCEAVCSTHGGYTEGTKSFTGSGGTPVNCVDILVRVGISINFLNDGSPYILNTTKGGAGCFTLPYEPGILQAYWDKDPTISQAVVDKPDFQRLCSCQK